MVGESKQRVQISVDRAVLERLNAVAKQTGVSKSSIMGIALVEWLNRNEKTLSK